MSRSARQRLASIGLVEWLPIGDMARVDRLLADLRALRVPRLRTQFSWADWHTAEGRAWYEWLLPRLAAECELLPCFGCAPPSPGLQTRTASPLRDADAYADFLDQVATQLGGHFEWVELWNSPDGPNEWSEHPDRENFLAMIAQAAHRMRRRGKKTLLGGMRPDDSDWLSLMARRGALTHIDAIGIHELPGNREFRKRSWGEIDGEMRALLDTHGIAPEIWLTEVGYSTWRHDEAEQLRQLRAVLDAPFDRVYWYSAYDLHDSQSHQDGFHEDERQYHFGLKGAHGRPKLAYRLWAAAGFDGIDQVAVLHGSATLVRAPRQTPAAMPALSSCGLGIGETRHRPALVPVPDAIGDGDRIRSAAADAPRAEKADEGAVLITGGAGFVGTNLAARLLGEGRRVIVYDNLSRPGVERNLQWLRSHHGERLQVEIADVRDPHLLRDAVSKVAQVFHFAAQVAVTSSLDDPTHDFDVNLRGTFNVLEAVRRARRPPSLVFTSTNKVYGALDDVALEATETRYRPREVQLRRTGIGEDRPLDFHSPYGCSKGGADQYVLDYGRSYGLRAVVLRMSCIYGPHQFGNEDQGWVAHFLIRALEGMPITLYGDGRQVRDILFVEDLVEALLLCQRRMPELSGHAFNMGGGTANTISLVELLQRIGALTGRMQPVNHAAWRTGDQRYYVSDTRAFAAATGWSPRVHAADGVARLYDWLRTQRVARDETRTHVA